MATQSFGIVGLEVMGRNIALNIEEKGFPIAVYNRTTSKAEEFVADNPGKNIKMGATPQEFIALLTRPRKILLMVKAGFATDATIDALKQSGVLFEDYDFPGLKTDNHVCVLGAEKAAWFKDTEGNLLCLHEDIPQDLPAAS